MAIDATRSEGDPGPLTGAIVGGLRMRLLDILDIGTDPADDADLVLRKRTAVATLLALCLAGLAYIAMGWLGNRPLVLLFSVLQIGGQLLNLAIFGRLRRLEPFVWTTIGLGLRRPGSARHVEGRSALRVAPGHVVGRDPGPYPGEHRGPGAGRDQRRATERLAHGLQEPAGPRLAWMALQMDLGAADRLEQSEAIR